MSKKRLKTKHPLYYCWNDMKHRCRNKNYRDYKYYGARGIDVCLHWRQDITHFIKWALEFGYEEGLSIDRKNARIGYCPANCEWVSISENSRRMNEARRNESTVA